MTTPPATPPAAQTREPGFYWVRYTTSLVNTDWFVAELRNDAWWPTGEDIACAPDEIGPRIPSFAERPGDAALAEAIRWVSTLEMHSAYIYDRLTPADIQRLDALEDAARRALSPAPRDGGWLPIESAPRDGTRFLAHQAGRAYYECWWQDDFAEWSGWQNDHDNEPEPTHWRPLPAPPTEDGR